MEIKYIEPTLRSRTTLIVLYVTVFIWYVTYHVYVDPQIEHITTLEGCEMYHWVQLEVIYFSCLGLAMLMVCFTRAYQILKYKQFPVPSAYVFKKTEVVFGRKAIFEGLLWLFYGVIVFSGMCYAYYFFDVQLLFSDAVDKECLTSH